jgi:hypothetical protein
MPKSPCRSQRKETLQQSAVGRWMIRNQALTYFPLLGLARVSWALQGLQYAFPWIPTVCFPSLPLSLCPSLSLYCALVMCCMVARVSLAEETFGACAV